MYISYLVVVDNIVKMETEAILLLYTGKSYNYISNTVNSKKISVKLNWTEQRN